MSEIGTPLWKGGNLNGEVIYVTAEQGLGDEILFASMIDDLHARGAHVIWEADKRLWPILRRSYPQVSLVERTGIRMTYATCWSPAGSLGRYLRTSAADFPKARRSYLKADTTPGVSFRVGLPGGLPIGISWRSSNAKVGGNKTIPLDQWAPIFNIPGATFIVQVDWEPEFYIDRNTLKIHAISGSGGDNRT